MSANNKFTARISVTLCSLMLGVALGYGSVASAQADDTDKLKELERAMSQPQEPGAPNAKKRRTRAIVFDGNENEAPASTGNERQAAQPSSGGQLSQQLVSGGQTDCSFVTPRSEGVSVDFAIQFNANSATITPASRGTLRQIARILSLSPEKCVLVEGHTDISGDPQRNQELSQERAESVVNYISSSTSVDRKRLVPVGKGFSETLKDLDPRDPKNRRVVFKVVTK